MLGQSLYFAELFYQMIAVDLDDGVKYNYKIFKDALAKIKVKKEQRDILLGLRAAGWTDKEINDFVLYIESGEEQYKPKPRESKQN